MNKSKICFTVLSFVDIITNTHSNIKVTNNDIPYLISRNSDGKHFKLNEWVYRKNSHNDFFEEYRIKKIELNSNYIWLSDETGVYIENLIKLNDLLAKRVQKLPRHILVHLNKYLNLIEKF